MSTALELITPIKILGSPHCYAKKPKGARGGVMLHFDDSSNDESAVEWFTDPKCHVAYNRLYLDNGDVVQITTSMEEAAYHAGYCRTPNANRFFYGLAVAANEHTPVTVKQFESIAHDVAALFWLNQWAPSEVTRRVVGHEDEAIYTEKEFPKSPKLWGKLGRKIDPTGFHPNSPILSTAEVRKRVSQLLLSL